MVTGLSTTRLSSKGQVVIPEEVRKLLGLRTGDKFVVLGRGDAVILKTISEPSLEQFEELLGEVQNRAKKAGMKKADVQRMISKVRKES